MRKQLFRVKQFADQTFSRGGKTEVLTDDLQDADRHTKRIEAALTALNKRLGYKSSESNNFQDPAYKDKRLKKCPEYVLGQTMLDNAGEDGLMFYTLNVCGKAQVDLANETVDHEIQVEQLVAHPLHDILDTDVPNILKQKANLKKAILDMDSLRARYQQALKHNTGGTGANKEKSLKDELEEAEAKVEQCRDQLAAEMFQLMSRESVLAEMLIQYIKLQRAYHDSASHCLANLIPDLESYINDNNTKPVYGLSLEEHLRVTNRKIAFPIQLCVSALIRLGMEEEGLFRIAAGASKLRRMKLSFDACCLTLPIVLEYKDPHVIAGALKSYLRELPEPLFTNRLYPEWMAAAKISQHGERLQALWDILHKLPTANFENLKFLIKFFAFLTKNHVVNKMNPHNIAIVVAPSLIWLSDDGTTSIVMDTANSSSLIVEQLITYVDYFFPEDVDFDCELDFDNIGVNGSEVVTSTLGMRRCMSNSSLNDHNESPPQGSPKPATRRKNKPAPTPPSGNTPDKQHAQPEQIGGPVNKRPDEKPPPAPDKPPRPLSTATLNRSTYKAQKHDQVTAELVQSLAQQQDNARSIIQPGRNLDNDLKLVDFETNKVEVPKETQNQVEVVPLQQTDSLSISKADNHRKDSDDERMNINLIGFEGLSLKMTESTSDLMNRSFGETTTIASMSESTEKLDSPKPKPVPAEKPAPSTLERRKFPVATPRSLANVTANQQGTEDPVEFRKKSDGSSISPVDRASKPAIPERPAGLTRPSSLIRPHPRHSTENLDTDSGPLTLERTYMYSVDKQQVSMIKVRGGELSNGTNASSTINLQRSPSVGSRPVSMSISVGPPFDKAPPPRPEPPDHVKSHSRTRSEGNIIDVQTQTQTVVVPRSSLMQQQVPPASPRFLQRPPRPQPPPPPPPTNVRPKSDNESTNL